MQQTWFGKVSEINIKLNSKAINKTTKSLNKIRTLNPHSLIVFKILNLFKTFELCCCCSSFPQPSYASEEEEEKFIVATADNEEGSSQAEISDLMGL